MAEAGLVQRNMGTLETPRAEMKLVIAPGVTLWREKLDRAAQIALLDDVLARLKDAPFYRPRMPKSNAYASREMTTKLHTSSWKPSGTSLANNASLRKMRSVCRASRPLR